MLIRSASLLGIASVLVLSGDAAVVSNNGSGRSITFTKDIAPIFQKSCQNCHHAGTSAPMSLMTYNETRPWARSIKERVVRREMPPWHLDKTVGIRKYKNDISLSDEEIASIVKWVDEGAPQGNAADLPKPLDFSKENTWFIGTPDVTVTTDEFKMYAQGSDWWIPGSPNRRQECLRFGPPE